jgi:hypothetical protein
MVDKKQIKALSKQTPIDHIVNSIKALVNAWPVGGGIVSSLISDYIPKSRERKTIEFLSNVAEGLETLKDQIDKDYIKSAEFEYLFQKAWRAAIEQYQEEKIEGFRAILLNSAIGKEATVEEKELFINILTDLTGYHFQMIKVLQDPSEWNVQHGMCVKSASVITSFNQIFKQCFPDWDDERIAIIVDDLNTRKLISLSSERLMTGLSGGGIEKLNSTLTNFGRRFVDYITQS